MSFVPSYPRRAFCLPTALFVAFVLVALPVHGGQEKPAANPAADPVAVLANINDLGLLRALLPLKLTRDQITPLLTVLRKVEEDSKALLKQDADILRALAAEVETARTAALSGAAISTELENRVAAASTAAETRRKAARNQAVGRILAVVKASFTSEQQKLIAAQTQKAVGGRLVPREYQKDPSKAPPEAVQDLAVGYFIDKVLLNERSITVLAQMKPPTEGAADTSRPPAPPANP